MTTNNPIDKFIGSYPKDIRALLQQLRLTIKKAVPEAEEITSYGIPTFDLNGRHLVHFSAFKNHIGFYPTPRGINAFKKELSKYKGAKGSVQFPVNKPLPLALVVKITKFRAREVLEKTKRKSK